MRNHEMPILNKKARARIYNVERKTTRSSRIRAKHAANAARNGEMALLSRPIDDMDKPVKPLVSYRNTAPKSGFNSALCS